jgi:hypothetical protein
MDVIIEHLEKESNLYKRVDLFFLVDSIIQCCRNQKGTCIDFSCFLSISWVDFFKLLSYIF